MNQIVKIKKNKKKIKIATKINKTRYEMLNRIQFDSGS